MERSGETFRKKRTKTINNPIMKKLTITLIFGLLLTGFSVSMNAQKTVEATASAELVEALSVTEGVTELNFGRFIQGDAEGSVVIAASDAGTRINTGGVILVSGGYPASAEFKITGLPGTEVNISLPSEGVINLTHPTNTEKKLNISIFTISEVKPTLSSGGEATVYVGGSLTVPAKTNPHPNGIYSGEYPVTFSYE